MKAKSDVAIFDEGDVYYQIMDGDKVEATCHTRAWNVENCRSSLVKRYGEQKEPKQIHFITRDEYRAIIWPKKK